jgi:hypothetical protein
LSKYIEIVIFKKLKNMYVQRRIHSNKTTVTPKMSLMENSILDDASNLISQNLKNQSIVTSSVPGREEPALEYESFSKIILAISVIEDQLLDQIEALRRVRARLVEDLVPRKKSNWRPIVPIPNDIDFPDISRNNYLNFMLKDGYRLASIHDYRDICGKLKGHVVRFEKEIEYNGETQTIKSTLPLSYCMNEKGKTYWRWKAFETKNKSPYGIEKLDHDPSKPILIVEGEKTADSAQKMLPEYNVLTWSGGASNVNKTNWQCLGGKEITIWPDFDESGRKAAATLYQILASLNAENNSQNSVNIVSLPELLPVKWDLADPLPEGWTLQTIKDLIAQAKGHKS